MSETDAPVRVRDVPVSEISASQRERDAPISDAGAPQREGDSGSPRMTPGVPPGTTGL
jgi:hypothetical protein